MMTLRHIICSFLGVISCNKQQFEKKSATMSNFFGIVSKKLHITHNLDNYILINAENAI